MTADLVFERLLSARSEVEQVCILLASPTAEVLDRCTAVLESASAALISCQPWLKGAQGNPEVLSEAGLLQRAVRRASRLLQSAYGFYMRWSQAWLGLTAGYTPFGESPAPPRRGLVWVTG